MNTMECPDSLVKNSGSMPAAHECCQASTKKQLTELAKRANKERDKRAKKAAKAAKAAKGDA